MARLSSLYAKIALSCAAVLTVLILFYNNIKTNEATSSGKRWEAWDQTNAKRVTDEYKSFSEAMVPFSELKSAGPIFNSSNQMKMVTNESVAESLRERVRVLCWIAVTESTVERAKVIKQTWGRRCTELVLIGDESTSKFEDIVTIDVPKGRDKLWDKTKEAFRYVYQKYYDKVDWFLKADTDTYFIMENLRLLLASQDPDKPAYLGCTIKLYIKDGYNSGGAGYVLNRKSLHLLINESFKNSRCDSGYMQDEDVSMGYCLAEVGVLPGDPTDENGKNRFFPFEPADHVSPAPYGAQGWYWRSTYKPGEKNIDCCSDTWISFHYVSQQLLWNMEFLLYHSKIFGVTTSLQN